VPSSYLEDYANFAQSKSDFFELVNSFADLKITEHTTTTTTTPSTRKGKNKTNAT